MGTASRQLPAEGNGREVSVEDLLQAPTARQPGLQAPTAMQRPCFARCRRQLIDAGDELRQLLAEPTARQSPSEREKRPQTELPSQV